MSTILETRQLTKIYGKQVAVDNVSISIQKGDIYGLIGRNGAGKTTLMRMVSGLAEPSKGSYLLFGRERPDAHTRPRLGCLIENTGTYPNLTAYEHLHLKSLALGIHDKGHEMRLLELVNLQGTDKKKVKHFSLGMKQRLGFALALVGNPDLVILDEPINGLDPQGIVEVRSTIERLNRELGLTFIISSHILDELAKIATRFSIIDRGRLIEEINRDELAQKSRERIELVTSNSRMATTVLDRIGIRNYKVLSDHVLHVFDDVDRSADIVVALAQNNIKVNTLTIQKNSLEDHYLELTNHSAANSGQGGLYV